MSVVPTEFGPSQSFTVFQTELLNSPPDQLVKANKIIFSQGNILIKFTTNGNPPTTDITILNPVNGAIYEFVLTNLNPVSNCAVQATEIVGNPPGEILLPINGDNDPALGQRFQQEIGVGADFSSTIDNNNFYMTHTQRFQAVAPTGNNPFKVQMSISANVFNSAIARLLLTITKLT